MEFDTRAAYKYAQILNGRFEEVKNLAAENQITRQRMKLDHLIISCAFVNNASNIYSYDKELKAYSSGLIEVKEFPFNQTDLFGNNIIK